MKRLILLLVIGVLISGNGIAQSMDDGTAPILLNYATLEKKVAKSDEAIVHEKKKLKSKTWESRGALFQDVDNQGLEQAQLGMDKKTLELIYGEAKSKESTDDRTEVYTYEHIKYIFEDGRLRGWERTDPIIEAPLDEALRSFQKAIELTDADKQMKYQEKIKKDLDELKEQYLRHGLNTYYLKNYNEALAAFESILEVNEIPVYSDITDTMMINYCGITARDIGVLKKQEGKDDEAEKMFRKAIKYYSMLADIGYGGSTAFRQMTGDYYAIGDTLGALENLKKGLEMYPDSSVLVSLAAQAYYQMKDNEAGLEFIDERLDVRPECAVAYYWKGLLITNTEDVEEETIKQALALYDTSLMYNPQDGNVWYQSGYVNYAVGQNYFEQEGYEEDEEFRKELNAKGHEYYETAVEKLEKTYEVSPDNELLKRESLDLLKRIYYKLYGSDDERYMSVTERMNEL